jgi:cardiolipin synthase
VSIDLFRDAVQRGVRVRVMVAGLSNDTLVTRYNSVRLYGALLDAGVELYEYNRTMMHHKIMMIDGLWSTVGTANFDNRSFAHNEESNVSVLNEAVARELTESYERDLAVSERVTKEAWKRRGLPHKTVEALASFVQDQV